MLPTQSGAMRLFQFRGITVFLHYSWLIAAPIMVSWHQGEYSSITWNAFEYIGLFVLVLMHEFGHSFACRSVGGQADQIVLWPLGGVAYVNPPERPGPQLWSIAAGPLVNVAMLPVFYFAIQAGQSAGWEFTGPDTMKLLKNLGMINLGLLIFNMVPVFPLDGGQILRSLLWFPLGRARSLFVATLIGIVGALALGLYAFSQGSIWLGIMAGFIFMTCLRSWQQSRAMLKFAKAPRRNGFGCPHCQVPPPKGDFWTCGNCQQAFDIFEERGTCPKCQAHFTGINCMECHTPSRFEQWDRSVVDV